MNVILTIFIALIAAAVGYLLATSKAQRALAAAQSQATAAKALLESERRHSAEALQQQAQTLREQAKQQADALRAEFRAISADMIDRESATLRTQHLERLDGLLKPLGDNITQFRTQFVSGHASLDRYIHDLIQQTTSLGREAENLALALKSNNKVQGNWGEAVLDNLLAASGLTEGRDYELQSHLSDGSGSTAIPDVIVHLPENRNVIIDSKVSLTAFTSYVAANDAEEQKRLLKDHVRSVRQHIKELSEKNYDRIVPNSIGYVLMFIPGESAYMAALNAEPKLTTEAYKQHVILLNPSNLLMALQLAYNLWQSELQKRSVAEIYNSADRIYKKFVTFSQNFLKIGRSIDQLKGTYDTARGQLSEGRGNIVSQLEKWRDKGLTPSAQIPQELSNESDNPDEE